MKSHGGARKGAGRPKRNSPLGYLRVLEDPRLGEPEKTRAAQGLAQFRWERTARQGFLRSAGVDYGAIRRKVNDQLWDALLVGLPKMAERGDVVQAWFAYRMITRRSYGTLRPRPAVLAKVRELAPQGARALWRISVANDPKHPLYKSTGFLKIRRQARRELCRGIGIPITRELVRVPGNGFVRLLFETIARLRPTLTPEQAVVLAAWGDSERSMPFLARGLKIGMFRAGWARRPQRSTTTGGSRTA